MNAISAAYRVHPISATARLQNPPQRKPQGRYLSLEEMEQQDGIKAQHAAARFIIDFLKAANNGWTAEETEVGGHYDRQGFDLLLVETSTRRVIPADLSFAYKDEASVQYKREWFDVDADGSWVFRKEFAQPLFRQFVKLMSSNQHFTR